jgi:hypothetical protein
LFGAAFAVAALFASDCVRRAPPSGELQRMRESPEVVQFRAVSLAVAVGTGLFLEFHDSYPNDLRAVCDSPYIPIRCEDLKLDQKGKPLSVALGDPDPWARLLKSSDPKTGDAPQVFLEMPPNSITRPPVLLAVKPLSPSSWKDIRLRLKPEERAALSVVVFLDALQDEYHDIFLEFPEDFASLGTAFPGVIPYLRNDFNGSYARLVEQPGPGDLIVKRLPPYKNDEPASDRKKFYVEIYGRGGPIPGVTDYGWGAAGGYEATGGLRPH